MGEKKMMEKKLIGCLKIPNKEATISDESRFNRVPFRLRVAFDILTVFDHFDEAQRIF